jgi:manganese transport protein
VARSYLKDDNRTPPHPKVQLAARQAIEGRSRGLRAILPFLGPAFIACIAYIDPGNFATNIQGGAEFGYDLLWVILLANIMAILLQGLAAKLGIATGMNLAEVCRTRFPTWVNYCLWITQEITAMATDLAEVLGAAIGITLLTGMPMLASAVLTGMTVFIILALQGQGFRQLEIFIGGCAGVIALCYLIETLLARPAWAQVFYHSVVPSLPGNEAVLLAVGIIGATVMPHVIYLHSDLTRGRIVPTSDEEARRIVAFNRIDVLVAMGLAGVVNMAMLFMSARVFHFTGHADVADINSAFQTLTPLLGNGAAIVFAVSLIASGVSSSHVGTMAGQVVMQGFVDFRIPIWLRRLATLIPALVVIYLKVDPTRTLVVSQVVLSFTLPIPVITLIMFTRNREIMGKLVNRPVVTALAVAAATLILFLNFVLLYQTFGGRLPASG